MATPELQPTDHYLLTPIETAPAPPAMTNWRDVKAKACTIDPLWNSADRVAQRARIREEMLASVSGAQPAGIRNAP